MQSRRHDYGGSLFHGLRKPAAYGFSDEDKVILDFIQQEGLCMSLDQTAPGLFFPDARKEGYAGQVEECKTLCAKCPVKKMCGEHALKHESYGLWGGMTIADRIRERKKRGMRPI